MHKAGSSDDGKKDSFLGWIWSKLGSKDFIVSCFWLSMPRKHAANGRSWRLSHKSVYAFCDDISWALMRRASKMLFTCTK
jgi:hypothetical protein